MLDFDPAKAPDPVPLADDRRPDINANGQALLLTNADGETVVAPPTGVAPDMREMGCRAGRTVAHRRREEGPVRSASVAALVSWNAALDCPPTNSRRSRCLRSIDRRQKPG